MQKTSFNLDWIFYKDGSKARQSIDLPHDAMLYEQRRPKNASTGACANFDGGLYHYEKTFFASVEWAVKHTALYFEGSYRNNTIILNGKKIESCAYGYSSFSVSLDDALLYGQENRLEVIVDNSQTPNSRWYTGSGIYRPVWLLQGEMKHIVWRGIKITTESIDPAVVHIQTEHTGGEVKVEVCKDDQIVATAKGADCSVTIPNAQLWSDENPALYTCCVTLWDGETQVDKIEEIFGIRQITWNSKGLFVNGRETLLRGGCVHHDNGILGAKSYAKAEWRRVKKLKEMGYNAIRSSHNPASEEMIKACDYYGLFVMDELWDMWYNHKNKCDYASDFMENYEADIRSMVCKDYNHPSVIMYSIGNEVAEPASEKGQKLEKKMIDLLHNLDASRPVSGGFNLMIIANAAKGKSMYKEEGGLSAGDTGQQMGNSSMMFNIITTFIGSGMNKAANSKKADAATSPALDALDIAGYNYASGRYPLESTAHPNRVIFGSETFPMDLGKNWAMVKKYPYLVGDFMWTAWDYLGEAGSGAWAYTPDGFGFEKPYPWILAEMGTLDILGNPNGEALYTSAVWGKLPGPRIAVRPVNKNCNPAKSSWRGTNSLPTWSWEGCDGKKAVVEVFCDANTVKLFLNNKCIGVKKVRDYRAIFKTRYTPGKLVAVAYDTNGNLIGRDELLSATGKKTVAIRPEDATVKAGDILYFNVNVVGENGEVESNHDIKLKISAEGGTLLGFGSANPRTEESYVSGEFTTYYGCAQAIVLAGAGEKIVLKAEFEGQTQKCEVTVSK